MERTPFHSQVLPVDAMPWALWVSLVFSTVGYGEDRLIAVRWVVLPVYVTG